MNTKSWEKNSTGLSKCNDMALKLSMTCGPYDRARALIDGTVQPEDIDLEIYVNKSPGRHTEIDGKEFDAAEFYTATYIADLHYKTLGYTAIPIFVKRMFRHWVLAAPEDSPFKSAADLNGKRIGVRAYTQTTGCWVRGFLAEDYGADLSSLRIVTFEDPHLAEYRDPPNVERAPEGKTLKQMLIDGEIDAAILGDVAEEGPLLHLIPDHEAAGRDWARRHGGVPINHLAVMRESIVKQRPDVVREVYRVLKESRAAATGIPTGADNPLRFGIGAIRQSLEQINAYAMEQKLIPRAFSADELFADAARILGADAA